MRNCYIIFITRKKNINFESFQRHYTNDKRLRFDINNKIIQFTFETQIDNGTNFLDLIINRIHNDVFNINIYRKPTQTYTIISNDYNHQFSKEVSYFNSLFYRLERIPLNEFNYVNKLNITNDVGIKNNFDIIPLKKIHK